MVIDELKAIQDKFGYIPEKELYDLAARLKKPVYDLHGVASFYPHFRLKPPPKTSIKVCRDLPCRLRQGEALYEKVKELADGDPAVEVEECSCLGQCDGAPAVMLNDAPYARQWPDELLQLARRAIAGEEVEHQHFTPARPADGKRFRTDPYENESDRYGALKALIASGDYEGVLAKIKAVNLRGMGGAGTPASLKWDGLFKNPAEKKYIVCNADESEVGTIKDREILKNLPYLLIEAMTIAAMTLRADEGFIYIRHEYHEQIEILEAELIKARAAGIIGKNVCGSGRAFDLKVFVSPGGYVQGEETALLEAIEGKRGQPRNKMVDVGLIKGVPAFTGLFGKPTLVNNVETFIYLPVILTRGPQWFIDQGVNGCMGLKWIGAGGQVNNGGVFEVSMGTRYTEVIEMCGGMLGKRELKAFCPSGPTGGFLPASVANTPMDFPDRVKQNEMFKVGGTVGSAAIVFIAEGTCLVDAALNYTRFYRNESCGKCVPCRVGSQKLVDIIAGITTGSARDEDLKEIARLSETLNLTSICGLGQVVPKPIETVLKYWRQEVDDHLQYRKCPSGICFQRPLEKPAVEAGGKRKRKK